MRYAFLALLATGPAHGYELRHALDERFGPALAPLNAGQVYTTLQRLERDGLIEGTDVPEDSRNKRIYALTDAGREALTGWIDAPVSPTKLRDEFFLKLALGGLSGIADAKLLIDRQRRALLQALRALDDAAATASPVASLLVEGTALHVKADLDWLDLCERRLIREDGNDSAARG